MNSEYKVITAKTVFRARNIQIEWNGWFYDVVYWQTEKGYFLAIPNHNISCVISEPDDSVYNLGKIFKECNNETMALVITQAIKEGYEEWKKKC